MSTNETSDDLRDEYHRLLRWYPRAWKERNEKVVIGALLDEAHEAGRSHPTTDDRRSLLRGAVVARLVGSGRRSTVGVCALAAGVAFSLFYVSLIGWDPTHHYAGYVGPFTNPSVVIGALLAVALGLALAKFAGAAHLVAVVAAIASVVIGILAWHFAWLGPSQSAVVLFAGLALLGLSHQDGLLRAIRMIAAVPALAIGADFVVGLLNPGVIDRWMTAGFASIAFAAAILLAWPWRSRRATSHPDETPLPESS